MPNSAITEHRQQRLSELVDALGGKALVGREMGYKDGSYIDQMIKGRRAITEKFVMAAEAKFRRPGWFAAGAPKPEAGGDWPFSTFSPAQFYALEEAFRRDIEDKLLGAIVRMERGLGKPDRATHHSASNGR